MECLRSLTPLLPRALWPPQRSLCALALGLTPVARPAAACTTAAKPLGRTRAALLCRPRPRLQGTALPVPRGTRVPDLAARPGSAVAAPPRVPFRPWPAGAPLGGPALSQTCTGPQTQLPPTAPEGGCAVCPARDLPAEPSLLTAPWCRSPRLSALVRRVFFFYLPCFVFNKS